MVAKDSKCFKDRRPAARRFVPGNTAFKTMQNVPLLEKAAMMKVPSKEREAILRNVVGTDKWTPGLGRKSSGGGGAATGPGAPAAAAGSDEEEEAGDEDDPLAGTTDADGNVVLFHMELHPKVSRPISA